MHIHQVLLVPACGHCADDGSYDRGRCLERASGSVHEIDVIDAYLPAMVEELDCESIRHEVMNTRIWPGVGTTARAALVDPHTLVVHCQAGWAAPKATRERNCTRVAYAGSSLSLAEQVAEAIGEWGHCYVHGHKTANPKIDNANALLTVPDTLAIAIEPFALNGPDVETYTRYLEQLGRTIARALADYLQHRDQAQRGGRLTMPAAPFTPQR